MEAAPGPVTQVTADHREHAAELIEILRETYRVQVTIETIPLGDYRVGPDTLVERKTVRDFCVSLIDGRLFDQAFRLSQWHGSALVLVEGPSFAECDIDVSLPAVKGALACLAQTYRLPVLRSWDQRDSAWYLNCLATQEDRIGTRYGLRAGRRPKRLSTRKLHVLQGLPGVGRQMAELLLESFGSVENVIVASVEDLQAVPGIGPKRAEQIRSVLREPPAAYHLTPDEPPIP